MNQGIKILIDRTRTNPEDFMTPMLGKNYISSGTSWRNLAEFAATNEAFTEEERAAVTDALRQVTRLNFTAKILETLAALSVEEQMRIKHMEHEMMMQMNAPLTATLTGANITKASISANTSGSLK